MKKYWRFDPVDTFEEATKPAGTHNNYAYGRGEDGIIRLYYAANLDAKHPGFTWLKETEHSDDKN